MSLAVRFHNAITQRIEREKYNFVFSLVISLIITEPDHLVGKLCKVYRAIDVDYKPTPFLLRMTNRIAIHSTALGNVRDRATK